MARRRYRRRSSSGGCGSLLALLFTVGLPASCFFWSSKPLYGSLVFGVLAALFTLGLGIVIQLRRKERANRLAAMSFFDMQPIRFEYAVAELFRLRGYRAEVTPGSNDRGIDIFLSQNGEKLAVQCKRYQDAVQPAAVREFAGALSQARLKRGYIVTTSGFTKMAHDAAQKSGYDITLIDGQTLGGWHNQAQSSYNTNLFKGRWWSSMTSIQRIVLVSLGLMVIAALVTVVMYGLSVMAVMPPLTGS